MTDLTEAELDEALARLRRPRSEMGTEEAALDLALAASSGRTPSPQAVEVRRRVTAMQEAAAVRSPWHAAAPWDEYAALLAREEHLAELWSSRQGQTVERCRESVWHLLGAAWATGGQSNAGRYEAVQASLARETRRFEALSPIATPVVESAHGGDEGKDLTEAELDAGLAKISGRTITKEA